MMPAMGKTLRTCGNAFRKQAWIIALVVVLAVGGAAYRLAGRAPQYQAEGSIMITPQVLIPSTVGGAGLTPIQSAYRETVLNDIIHLLRSRTISERVAARVGGLSPGELSRRVAINKIPGTDFLAISAVHEVPGQAALVVNAMTEELANFYAQINRAEATTARTFIEEQMGVARDQLSAAEQALLEFRTRTGNTALPDEVARAEQRAADLQSAYDAATLDETSARARVAAIRSHLVAQNDERLASISIATNPVITQIRDHLTGLELQLADLRQMYTDEHPKVKALLGQIADDQQRLRAEAGKVVTDTSLGTSPIRAQLAREMVNGEVDAATARAKAAAITPILNRFQARLNTVPNTELALARLQRDVKNAEELSARLSAMHEEALIRETQAGSSGRAAIVVVDPALAPDRPLPTHLPEAGMLAGLLGLCLGATLAVAVESLEARVGSGSRPLGALGVPALAAVPPIQPWRSYRYLTTAAAIASLVLLPILVVSLGAGADPHVALAGAMPAQPDRVGQALVQVFHSVWDVSVGQERTVLATLDRVSQALVQALHTAAQSLSVAHIKAMLATPAPFPAHGS